MDKAIRKQERFLIAGEKWIVSDLLETLPGVQMTRLFDGAIRQFTSLELRRGRHVQRLGRPGDREAG